MPAAISIPDFPVSNVLSYTRVGKSLYYHSRRRCRPFENPNDLGQERIGRVSTDGSSAARRLFSWSGSDGDCNEHLIRSNIVADDKYVYWVDEVGVRRLKATATVGAKGNVPFPQLMTAAIKQASDAVLPQIELVLHEGELFALQWISMSAGAESPTGDVRLWKVALEAPYDHEEIDQLIFAEKLATDGRYLYLIGDSDRSLRRYEPGAAFAVQEIASGVNTYRAEGLQAGLYDPIGHQYATRDNLFFASDTSLHRFDNVTGEIHLAYESQSDLRLGEITTVPGLLESRVFVAEGDSRLVEVKSIEHADPVTGAGGYSPVALSTERVSGAKSRLFLIDQEGFSVVGLFRETVVLNYGPLRRLTPTSQAPQFDTWVDRIEINQAIQDGGESVRLIEGKRTFVRVHPRRAGKPAEEVTADLYAVNATGEVLGGPWKPYTPQSLVPPRDCTQGPDCADPYQDALVFELPEKWTGESNYWLQAEINPNKGALESNYDNNTKRVFFSTTGSPRLQVKFFMVAYPENPDQACGTTGPLNSADLTDIVDHLASLRGMYPLVESDPQSKIDPGVAVEYGWLCIDGLAKKSISAKNEAVAIALSKQRKIDLRTDATKYYGLVPGISGGGVALGAPSSAAAGTVHRFTTTAHEIAHTLGTPHTGDSTAGTGGACKKVEQSPCKSPNLRLHGACYDCRKGCGATVPQRGSDDDYPCAGYPLLDCDPSRQEPVAGIDQAFSIKRGDSEYDVMSYCGLDGFAEHRWISPFNYERLWDLIWDVDPRLSSARGARSLRSDGPTLFVAGTIESERNGEILIAEVLYDVPPDDAGQATGFVLRQVDGTGHPIVESALAVTPLADGIEKLSFAQVVPFDEDTTHMQVIRTPDDVIVALRTVSMTAPSASNARLDAPPASASDVVTLRWDASDADGDSLTFELAYGVGSEVQPLMIGLRDREARIDTSVLPGGQGRFRVTASDGVRTSYTETATLTMPAKLPVPFITSPIDGAEIPFGAVVNLVGGALDLQDGTLGADALVWTIGDEQVGLGSVVSLEDLSAGENELVLTATNSAGLAASTSVTVVVTDDSPITLPRLVVNPEDFGSYVPVGSMEMLSTMLFLNTQGDGAHVWQATSSAPWVLVLNVSGETPGTIQLLIDPTSLGRGQELSAEVRIVASYTDESGFTRSEQQTVPVRISNIGAFDELAISCAGDCDYDGSVAMDELADAVQTALGSPNAHSCLASSGESEEVTVVELVRAVRNATGECAAD